MNSKKLVAMMSAGAMLAACDSGVINIAPSTVTDNSNNVSNTNSG